MYNLISISISIALVIYIICCVVLCFYFSELLDKHKLNIKDAIKDLTIFDIILAIVFWVTTVATIIVFIIAKIIDKITKVKLWNMLKKKPFKNIGDK
ncbi:hypothetical protein PMX22_20120 [Clostridium butyricum]|jgi:hypothetical protein|uniref:hypothetical protein n=1 Tax=Clostridium butyricum TaxID=1492 RepID=UPI0020706D60|nr:hypothetical protein [Clostridium butyricum]MDB2162093.1 hypothetical protein [Clostridium butyricum]DAQ97609.1 MAG TPA: hypothetical protein [Caudoviricetes sp.]